MGEREREREEAVSPLLNASAPQTPAPSPTPETSATQRSIDSLFDRTLEKSSWEPDRSPEVLGELLDSRYMLPLLLPTDSRFLSAVPIQRHTSHDEKNNASQAAGSKRTSQTSFKNRGTMTWRLEPRRLREIGMGTLRWIDGVNSAARWYRPPPPEDDDEEDRPPPPYSSLDPNVPPDLQPSPVPQHSTPLTRKPSARSKGRLSLGDDMDPEPLSSKDESEVLWSIYKGRI